MSDNLRQLALDAAKDGYCATKAEAWDEGYLAGRVDGYYQTIEEVNPYRESEEA